jgi:hypothetical protein
VHGHSADVIQADDLLDLLHGAGAVVEHLERRVGGLEAAHMLRVGVGAAVGGARRVVDAALVAGVGRLVAFARAQVLQTRLYNRKRGGNENAAVCFPL